MSKGIFLYNGALIFDHWLKVFSNFIRNAFVKNHIPLRSHYILHFLIFTCVTPWLNHHICMLSTCYYHTFQIFILRGFIILVKIIVDIFLLNHDFLVIYLIKFFCGFLFFIIFISFLTYIFIALFGFVHVVSTTSFSRRNLLIRRRSVFRLISCALSFKLQIIFNQINEIFNFIWVSSLRF